MRLAWCKRSWRGRLLVVVVLIAVVIPVGNELARAFAARTLGALVDGHATVASIRLGLRRIRVDQVNVWSPDCDEPMLSMERLAIRLSLLDGIRHGIWATSIVVERPQIQLQFAEDGSLLTRLPTSQPEPDASSITRLPFCELHVKHASLAIHQYGRESFQIADVDVSVKGDGEEFKVDIVAPSVLAGRFELESQLNVATFTADSRAQLVGLELDSRQLAQAPLVMPSVNAQPWTLTTTIELQQNGSLADLQQLTAQGVIQDLRIAMKDRPGIVQLN
ncbi:MAG: hypothetical protein KDB23_08315, partial [Planctomycetales bacterium]|nr:hypothetical protein [Planctomycetales bacterium]